MHPDTLVHASLAEISRLFQRLPPATPEARRGFYRARFVGPWWLRHSAGPRPQIILLTETAPAGASYVAGAGACPWPAADSDQLSLVRTGDELQLRVGEETVTCDVAALAAERVRLGISAPSAGGGATRVRSFQIMRRR